MGCSVYFNKNIKYEEINIKLCSSVRVYGEYPSSFLSFFVCLFFFVSLFLSFFSTIKFVFFSLEYNYWYSRKRQAKNG